MAVVDPILQLYRKAANQKQDVQKPQGPEQNPETPEEQQGDEKKGYRWLSSSNLSAFKYDGEEKKLEIVFQGGRSYTYRGVEEPVATGLGNAPSAGHYFHTRIKGVYPYSKGELEENNEIEQGK